MDITAVAALVGVGVSTISTIIQAYTSFRKSNVELLLDKLLRSGVDLHLIGEREDLQRYFFSVLDVSSREANEEKIDKWKNAVIHLATDFNGFDFKDNFLSVLSDLSVFDLTILYKIYTTNFPKEHFEDELTKFFSEKDVSLEMVMHSVKRLSSHNLISEQVDRTAVIGRSDGEPILGSLYYRKNDLGPQFIKFISEETNSK